MKLTKKDNVLLCMKGLYTKQLECYADLCQIYQKLANIAIDKNNIHEQFGYSVEDQIKSFYGPFIQNPDSLKGKNKTLLLNEEEVKLIKAYTNCSSALSQFRMASEKLKKATFTGKTYQFDSKKISDYHDFMQNSSRLTKSFDDFIFKNPKRYVGRQFYKKTKTAMKNIKAIDADHIKNYSQYEMLSPKTFFSQISGYRGTGAYNSFYNREDAENYGKKPSFGQQIGESAYRLKENIPGIEKYKAKKGSLKKAVAVALIAATLAGSGVHFRNVALLDRASASHNLEKGYVVQAQDSTLNLAQSIREKINNLRISPTFPTNDELMDIRNGLDGLISDTFSDLVTKAIQEKHPDYTNITVSDRYDFGINNNRNSSEAPKDTRFVVVAATNGKGKEISEIYSLNSIKIGKGPLYDSINDEITLDFEPSIKSGAELANAFNILNSNTSTFEEKYEKLNYILRTFEGILENTNHLAGIDVKVSPWKKELIAKAPKKDNSSKKNPSEITTPEQENSALERED